MQIPLGFVTVAYRFAVPRCAEQIAECDLSRVREALSSLLAIIAERTAFGGPF
jgi:hypothetical protein